MRADDAFGAVAALAASQHGAFSRRQAAQLDIGSDRLFRWKTAGRIHERLRGALTIAGAAALHVLDGFAEGPLEVTIPRLGTLRATEAVVHRRAKVPFEDWTTLDGIRCTGLARTLVDLGEDHDPKVVQRALDDARRRGTSMWWLRRTATRLQGAGRHGPGVLLDLLDSAEQEHAVPGSWFERLLELALACPELPPIVRQHEIRAADGALVARVDLVIPSCCSASRVTAGNSTSGNEPRQLDEDRDLAAAAQGWEILYLGWQATLRPKVALAKIRAVADARRHQLTIA
jgi:hypothetical protein